MVFSAHVLEHHPHPKAMLESINSKLKKDHTLVLVIPHERHGKGKFEYDLNQHLHTWNFQAINNLLITTGFKIQENRYIRGRDILNYCHLLRSILDYTDLRPILYQGCLVLKR